MVYRDTDVWRPIAVDFPEAKADALQSFDFEAVTNSAVRLEVIPGSNATAGIAEWIVK